MVPLDPGTFMVFAQLGQGRSCVCKTYRYSSIENEVMFLTR